MALEEQPGPTEITAPEILHFLDGGCHRWVFSGAATEIELAGRVLECLANELASARKHAASAKHEIGGLLFGSRDSERNVIRIESLDVYTAVALHDVLGLVKDRMAESTGLKVVGWFRLSPPGDRLNAADEVLMRSHFSGPGNVLLLMQPSEGAESRVQFVYWRGEKRLSSIEGTFAALPPASSVARPVLRDIDSREKPQAWWVRRNWPWAAAIALLFTGAAYWYQGGLTTARPEAAQTKRESESAGMNLFAVQERNLVRIVWDPKSSELFGALSGTLAILDGSRRISVPFDSMRLSAGLYWYSPSSDHVRVTMKVVDADGRETQKTAEVTVKLAPPSPVPPPDKEPVPMERRIPPLPSPILPPRPLPPRQLTPTSQFSPPQASSPPPVSSPVSISSPLPETPPILVSTPTMAGTPSTSSKPVVPAPINREEPVKSAVAGGVITPAIAMKEAQPIVPPGLRSFLTKPTKIEVRVTIDMSGKVVSAEALGGDGTLARSLARIAVDTARLWKFKPAFENGVPVQSTQTLSFVIAPR